MKRKGFTLIELLIVVAIIAILAAIALPNFLEAQMRAKVTRAMSDMRTIRGAIEMLRVDHNVLLVDFWDDDHPTGINRLHNTFGRWDQNNNKRGGTIGVLVPLTTPIAYLNAIPKDPFVKADFSLVRNMQLANGPWNYAYIDDDSQVPGQDAPSSFHSLVSSEYVLLSPGPVGLVMTNEITREISELVYDSTNGSLSEGMIIYSSRTGFDARTSH